jgi:ABC-type uncharacterized transport system permease subunit
VRGTFAQSFTAQNKGKQISQTFIQQGADIIFCVAAGTGLGAGAAAASIGAVGAFGDHMSNGKGFIALAAVIFGRWNPRGAVGVALLFGFTDALQTLRSAMTTPITIPPHSCRCCPTSRRSSERKPLV